MKFSHILLATITLYTNEILPLREIDTSTIYLFDIQQILNNKWVYNNEVCPPFNLEKPMTTKKKKG